MNYIKKELSTESLKDFCAEYHCDLLTSSILIRRNIVNGNDLLYYLEDDVRFLHNPFLFSNMEDAVDRILQARDENERVLIFGDKDVDGMTSTVILYTHLKNAGIDIRWKVPSGNMSYGLSLAVVEEFAADYGSLIITVDCGISNNAEIARAQELGVDVIVIDHHNLTGDLPEPAIIINPKTEKDYPFRDISGCALAYKTAWALSFAKNPLYKQEICLLNVRPLNETYVIEAIKTVNLREKARISETLVPGVLSIQDTRLVSFLQGQQIFVWNAPQQQKQLQKIFGKNVDFNLLDIAPEISQTLPSLGGKSLLRLKDMSKLARYDKTVNTEIDAFFNIFITYVTKKNIETQKNLSEQYDFDLQLVTLAALADIMPLKNENRIFIRHGLKTFNTGKIRDGLKELMARLHLHGKQLGSADLSWNVIPVINAAGRLGEPEVAISLLTEENPQKRDELAEYLINLNEKRKQLGQKAWQIAEKQVHDSLKRFNNKLILVADKEIHRGVTGTTANRLSQMYRVPAFVVTFFENGEAVGSSRSPGDICVTSILESCAELFINFGGHDFAAGFSFYTEKYQAFAEHLERQAAFFDDTSKKEEPFTIDASLPKNYITPELLSVVDKFEPYGEANPQLTFFASKLKITQADILGKSNPLHLKLTLDCGNSKWPAMFWGESERLNRDFAVGDYVDVIFRATRNTFNGTTTPQMILLDCEKTT